VIVLVPLLDLFLQLAYNKSSGDVGVVTRQYFMRLVDKRVLNRYHRVRHSGGSWNISTRGRYLQHYPDQRHTTVPVSKFGDESDDLTLRVFPFKLIEAIQ
jgi:hypothetical protein